MNVFATGNLFGQPLVLLAIFLLGALSSWLKKRCHRTEAANRPDDDELSPSPKPHARPEHEPDMQDILRRLLGGEPPPRKPLAPSIPPAMRGTQAAENWSDEEPIESLEAEKATRLRAQQIADAFRQRTASAEARKRREKPARRASLHEPATQPVTAMSTERSRRSRAGRRAALWRSSQTVREAFVASLVFAPPKTIKPCLL